jgi:hypothetical protein
MNDSSARIVDIFAAGLNVVAFSDGNRAGEVDVILDLYREPVPLGAA